MIVIDMLLWIVLLIGVYVGLAGILISFTSEALAPLFLIAMPMLVVCLILIKVVLL